MNDVKKVLGIMSCKGGVGKTTTAVNIALILSKIYNFKVGLFDADIYGPNHPKFFGIDRINNNQFTFDKKLIPIRYKSILSMSFGYYLLDDSPVLFRGPIVSNIFMHLLNNTNWGNIDFLVIDFPPGSGDIYVSLLKKVNLDYVFLVTTPSELSFQDVSKTATMLKKFNIPIIGLLENMKFYVCICCGSKNNLYFENNLVEQFLFKYSINNYYEMCFDLNIRKMCMVDDFMSVVKFISFLDIYKKMVNDMLLLI